MGETGMPLSLVNKMISLASVIRVMRVLFIALAMGVTVVRAEPAGSKQSVGAPTQDGLVITVGAAPVVSPVFLGSKDYGFSIFPDLRFKYGELLSASVPEGLTINAYNHEGLKLGPIAKIRFSRDEETGGSPFLVAGSSDGL